MNRLRHIITQTRGLGYDTVPARDWESLQSPIENSRSRSDAATQYWNSESVLVHVCDTTMALPQGRGTKRKVPHGVAVREALLELTGDWLA